MSQIQGGIQGDERQILENDHSSIISSKDDEFGPSKRQRAKIKVKKILHLGNSNESSSKSTRQEEENSQDLQSDPAFQSIEELERNQSSEKDTKSSSLHGLQAVKQAIISPKQTIKDKATKTAFGKIGSNHRGHLEIDQDQELVDLHDEYAAATSANSTDNQNDKSDKVDLEASGQRIFDAEEKREALQAAWMLGRYVDRVKVVPTTLPKPKFPSNQNSTKIEWQIYLGRLALYITQGFTSRYIDDFGIPEYDTETLTRIIERLAITSAPWQAFLLDVRTIYLWEDPIRTTRWALTFWTLWYTEHLVGGFYGLVVYTTVLNKVRARAIISVRESIQRRTDHQSKAMAWSELIQRHGNEDWFDPLMKEIGPVVQTQLSDFADFLEILVNFHQHERPHKSTATVIFFSICFIVTMVADMAFCVKLVWFIVGMTFFFSFPIATKYPRYRVLVSVLRWIFWDIPTQAESAIIKLQQRAVVSSFHDDEEVKKKNNIGDDESFMSAKSDISSSSDSEPESSIPSIKSKPQRYKFLLKTGSLIIARQGVEYHHPSPKHNPLPNLISTKSKSKSKTSYKYSNLLELSKTGPPTQTNLKSQVSKMMPTKSEIGLILIFQTQSLNHNHDDNIIEGGNEVDEIKLEIYPRKHDDRDRIFNLVLALSNKKWRVL